MNSFKADCLPLLIGSLPMNDHNKAIELVLENTPEIPLWVQLPVFKEEGMLAQFVSGMPGLTIEKDKFFIDTSKEDFDNELLEFYQNYMAVIDGTTDLEESQFVLGEDTARGFFVFMDRIKSLPRKPVALKGQITGPLTFCIGIKDQDGRSIFYHEQLRDAGVKMLGLKAGWQAKKLSQLGCPAIVFFDEPALAGFGSSAFISITRDDISKCFEEVIENVHSAGGIAGIHVCANADWSLVLNSSVDIISFDAYSFFDKFLLYPDLIKNYIDSSRFLAWGIVPTLHAEDIEKETSESLVAQMEAKILKLEETGIERSKILAQSFVTPSCGTGTLSLEHALKVLKLTKEVSERLRKTI